MGEGMNDLEGEHSVAMILNSLANVPQFALPDGYAIRPFQPKDEDHWTAIHKLADLYNQFDDKTFVNQFGTNAALLKARQFYLLNPAKHPIGTAAAWFKGDMGLVHWVAIVPQEQGKGLAKPLLTAVLQKLHELGHRTARLDTSSPRLPAINLYLKFGFQPLISTDDDKRIWDAIFRQLGQR